MSQIQHRYETALRAAQIYIFCQNTELRYTWVYTPEGAQSAAGLLGRTDAEILPEQDGLVAAKRRVIRTGVAAECEVSYLLPERRQSFLLHISPSFGRDNKVVGIVCTAVDASRLRSLASGEQQTSEELASALQRYEIALRHSNVTVSTQDGDLRYTAISSPMFGLAVADIVGRSDEEIVPLASRNAIIALKRDAIANGSAKDCEVSIEGDDGVRWYDLHIEPLRDIAGVTVGLTCASVDITERKEGEAHLRLLMRELTHRSKNLLAVIQAMARQTARYSGSIDAFLDQFNARLQALATSHDLLVRESWHGASLLELVRLQLGHYLDRYGSRLSVDGPPIQLKPEAAQSVGLALHELTTNAAKFGALSADAGGVAIAWRRLPAAEGSGVELTWIERGGPTVTVPARRGFGSLVIERNLARSLDAEVEWNFVPEGLRCRIVIPLTQLSAARDDALS